jgi:hypothetical protein
MAARSPPGTDLGADAKCRVGVCHLLFHHHDCELEIPLYRSYRFLPRNYSVLDCGRMAFGEARLKPLLLKHRHYTHARPLKMEVPARIDPQLLYPVKHRSAQAQADLAVIRARAGLVRARTGLVNTARGLAKSYGERLRSCNVRNLDREKAESLSPELQAALETNRSSRVRMEAWRQWLLGEEKKPCPMTKAPLDSDRPSHGRAITLI